MTQAQPIILLHCPFDCIRDSPKTPGVGFPVQAINSIRGGSRGRDAPALDHAQGLFAPAALCRAVLHSRLYRPHQCELRGAHHARGYRDVGRHVRLCGRHVLLGLLHLRSAEQCDHGKDRRPDLDRADHDHMGNFGGTDRSREGLHHVCGREIPARRCRSRVLPRHHPLFHLLVSVATITHGSSRASWSACRLRSRSARRYRRGCSASTACSG